jgi:hypothetical protein
MKEVLISELTIVTAQGVKTYHAGDTVNGRQIDKIRLAELYFTGDPFDHYIGYTKEGDMIFSVNCLVPCEIVYL